MITIAFGGMVEIRENFYDVEIYFADRFWVGFSECCSATAVEGGRSFSGCIDPSAGKCSYKIYGGPRTYGEGGDPDPEFLGNLVFSLSTGDGQSGGVAAT